MFLSSDKAKGLIYNIGCIVKLKSTNYHVKLVEKVPIHNFRLRMGFVLALKKR